jgi:hypothetical protein
MVGRIQPKVAGEVAPDRISSLERPAWSFFARTANLSAMSTGGSVVKLSTHLRWRRFCKWRKTK